MSLKIKLILGIEKLSNAFTRRTEPVNLPIPVAENEGVLICLPEDQPDPEAYQGLINKYSSLFAKQTVQFCAPSSQASAIQTSCPCLFYSSSSLSLSSRLDETIKQVIASTKYQLAIDLNQTFSLIAALICKATQARTRVTFSKSNAATFFNIQVKRQEDAGALDGQSIMRGFLQSMVDTKYRPKT